MNKPEVVQHLRQDAALLGMELAQTPLGWSLVNADTGEVIDTEATIEEVAAVIHAAVRIGLVMKAKAGRA